MKTHSKSIIGQSPFLVVSRRESREGVESEQIKTVVAWCKEERFLLIYIFTA